MKKENKEVKYRSTYYFITGVICGGLLIYVSSSVSASHAIANSSPAKVNRVIDRTWATLVPQLTVRYDYASDSYHWKFSVSDSGD
jgi:hypothetical protein